MILNINLDLNKKYVVACSYGPDSMALLETAIKSKINCIVAHVNYHKRDVSNFEQESLEKYCLERKIPFECLDTKGLECKGNFQEWARELRYNFFKDVCKKYKADAVLVAHQQDDLLETFLMQKNKKNHVKYYGIACENELFGVKIIRPLLSYTKQELLNFDIENNVPFSIDESNLTDHYTRNKIRHSQVENMSKEDRQKLLDEISNLNNSLFRVEAKSIYLLDEFLSFSNEKILQILDYFMTKTGEHRDISDKFICEIKKSFLSSKSVSYEITKTIILEKSYSRVYFVNNAFIKTYNYLIIDKLNDYIFDIDFSEEPIDRKITKTMFPLKIKNLDKNEKYIVKCYSSKVNRLFIDWKMPLHIRKIWPGIYDKNNNLVYIPRYKETFIDNHKSKLIINLEKLYKF